MTRALFAIIVFSIYAAIGARGDLRDMLDWFSADSISRRGKCAGEKITTTLDILYPLQERLLDTASQHPALQPLVGELRECERLVYECLVAGEDFIQDKTMEFGKLVTITKNIAVLLYKIPVLYLNLIDILKVFDPDNEKQNEILIKKANYIFQKMQATLNRYSPQILNCITE